MATKRQLRVATVADAPKVKPKLKTLEEIADGGNDLEFLKVALREMIRDRKDMTGPAKAAIYRQIILTKKEISLLEAQARDEQDGAGGGEVEDGDFDASAV